MTSIFHSDKSSDSDDDSNYEPGVELFTEEGKSVILNHEENTGTKSRTRNRQTLSGTNLYTNCKLKEVGKSEVNLVEAKNQADSVYKNFLEEAAAEMEHSKYESLSSEIVLSQISTGSSVNTGGSRESCSSKANVIIIPEKVKETTKNISSLNCNIKDFKSDVSTNSISNFKENSTTLSSVKRRDLGSVMGNVLKKRKKETILSMSMQDWKKFKEDEDIADELKTYNQGKKGYLEKKRFLERSDLRRFQIEREMRLSKKQTQGKNDF